MKLLPRSRRLARLARLARLGGCAALTLGLAGMMAAAAAPAQARGTVIPVLSHVVASWGDNSFGELGDGTLTTRSLYRDIAAGSDVVQVATGRTHNLALRSDGIVFVWGANRFGQVGNGATSFSPVTVPVKIAGLAQVTGISAGWDSSLATETSGISAVTSVWAWGNNDDGQLGDGTTAGHSTPERVTGLPVSIAGISVGGQFAAVLGTDGAVWGWGANGGGELNIAPPGSVVLRPVNVIAVGSRITQISAGGAHMLALRSDGTVLGWGLNLRGQLGNGSQTQVSGPVPVTGLTGATQVAAGTLSSYAVHTVLGLVGQAS
jgi:alpha-tubulin suppressor-like RCC1 family protein